MKNTVKNLFIAALIGASVLSVPSTVKAEDMRQTVNGVFGTYTEGYVTAKTNYKGADFSYGRYEDDELVNGDELYFDIVNKNTVKLVGRSKDTGCVDIDGDYLIYNGVHYTNIIIGSFKNDKKLESIDFRNVKKVELTKNCFYNCKSLENIKLYGTKAIPDGAFKNCSKLESFILNNGHNLKSIGRSAFEGCKSISEFRIVSSKYSSAKKAESYLKKHKITVKNNAFKKSCSFDMIFVPKSDSAYKAGGYSSKNVFKYESSSKASGMGAIHVGYVRTKK